MSKKGLGKGLGALIGSDDSYNSRQEGLTFLKVNEIEPRINQPRKKMDDIKLKELSESIRHHGIVQPIIVNQDLGVFRIVAGERRWRAARLAGLSEVPVIIKELTNKEVMEVALIENIQREDLNPLEEAEAFDRLLEEHNMTHEELSGIIGKSRPAISNALRLLGLSDEVKQMLANGDISCGHARALLPIEQDKIQVKVANQIIQNNISVRDTELLVKKVLFGKDKPKVKIKSNDFDYLINDLQDYFGTKVKILSTNKNKGKIMIEYYSHDDLDRIVEMISEARAKR